LAAHDRRRLMDELVVGQGVDHESREVDPARDVALQDRVTDVPAPHRKALALTLLEVAGAHEGPVSVAGEDSSTRLDLVVEVDAAGELGEPGGENQYLHLPRVDVLTVAGDVPSGREDQPCAWRSEVKDGLRRSRGVVLAPDRDEDGEDPVAAGDRPLDDLAVVRRTGDYGDALLSGPSLSTLPARHTPTTS